MHDEQMEAWHLRGSDTVLPDEGVAHSSPQRVKQAHSETPLQDLIDRLPLVELLPTRSLAVSMLYLGRAAFDSRATVKVPAVRETHSHSSAEITHLPNISDHALPATIPLLGNSMGQMVYKAGVPQNYTVA